MTTQAVTITTGDGSMSKIYSDSSTDGVWSGNVLLDTISQQSIGILVPMSTLTFVQPEYEAGAMAWRLQNAQTLAVSQFGFGCLAGQNVKQYIQPTRVSPNDILTAFPLASGSVGTSAVLAWVTTTKGVELFSVTDSADGATTELKTAVNNQTIGDSFFNSTLTSITVQTQDDAQLDRVEVVDNMGGVVMTIQGNYRGATPASRSNYHNLDCHNLSAFIGKGFKLNVVTVSA